MRIGILGTRGIPNAYGGFEQFAENVSTRLVDLGHEVGVYCSSSHPYQEQQFKGVQLIHCYDPEDKMGTAGQFIYDLNCILSARKQKFDVLLQLGYTSSSVWHWLLPKKHSQIITNMDGLEWKRTKFSSKVQTFLKYAERWAVNSSHHLVADSLGIQSYLKNKHSVESTYIAYGAENCAMPSEDILSEYNVTPNEYHMLVARMEPENNIEMILDGVVQSENKQPFLVIGNVGNDFSKYLISKFQHTGNIWFIGGVYNQQHLDALRWYSRLYFHGHSVGGTNPSLLEAMASNAIIAAHKNEFNAGVLGQDAFYFSSPSEVGELLSKVADNQEFVDFAKQENRKKIKEQFSWEKITQEYEQLFQLSLQHN